jgi:hypothetical protein
MKSRTWSTNPRTRSMKSRTWSTISTPGRQILGPGRRFLVLVDDSSDPIDFSRRFPLLVDKSSDPVNFSRRFQVRIDDSSEPIFSPRRFQVLVEESWTISATITSFHFLFTWHGFVILNVCVHITKCLTFQQLPCVSSII